MEMKTEVIPFDPRKGYPIGDDLFYKCEICGDMIPSKPPGPVAECKCKNIFIDVDAGRMDAQDDTKITLHRKIQSLMGKILRRLGLGKYK